MLSRSSRLDRYVQALGLNVDFEGPLPPGSASSQGGGYTKFGIIAFAVAALLILALVVSLTLFVAQRIRHRSKQQQIMVRQNSIILPIV
jgi:hypothetical protein